MKWWGWGDPQKTFPMDDKPNLWSWVSNILSINENDKISKPVLRSQVNIPSANINEEFLMEIANCLEKNQISISKKRVKN
jgi:hypothetical protein